MSMLKAKQVSFSAAGQLMVGDGTRGTLLSRGTEGQVLTVSGSSLVWTSISTDRIVSADGFKSVVASNTEVAINAGTAAATKVLSFVPGSAGATDEHLVFQPNVGAVTFTATGTPDDINIVMVPKGNGSLVVGADEDGWIRPAADKNITISGGEDSGNVFIYGSDTGKFFYAADDTDPSKEVATIGDIAAIPAPEAYKVLNFAGDATFTLTVGYKAATVVAFINGLRIDQADFSISAGVVTFDAVGLGYALEASDSVMFMFEI